MLHVRKATEADASTVADFTLRQVHEGEGAIKAREVIERGVRRGLADGLLQYWLLVGDDDAAVGCSAVSRSWSDWNAGFYWWVESMYVAPSHRGQGGMSMLVDAMNEAVTQEDGLQLRIYLNKDNKAGKQAYERCGFKPSVYEVMMYIGEDAD